MRRSAGEVMTGPLLAAILGAISLATTLPNPLLRDDVPMIAENPRIRGMWAGREVWLSDWWSTQAASAGRPTDASRDRLYRPLVLFSFAVQHSLHGVWPAGFRIFNIAAHIVCTVLVWRLGAILYRDRAAAGAAALLFAVHPIHVEAMAEAVGRADILAAMFVMLGILVLARVEAIGIGRTLAAAGSFFLALMSKETGICYFPIVGLFAAVRLIGVRELARGLSRWISWSAILALPLIAYLPLRYMATDGMLAFAGPNEIANPLFASAGFERFAGVFTILGHYARLLFFPASLCGDYGLAVVDPRRGPDAMTALGAVIAIVLVAMPAVWWWRGRWDLRGETTLPRTTCRLFGYSVCAVAFACAYFPISNVAVLIGTAAGERLCYLASAPVALVAGAIIAEVGRRLREKNKTIMAGATWWSVVGAVVVLLAVRSAARGLDWRSEEALYSADLAAQPRSVKSAVGMSRVLLARADRAANDADRRIAVDQAAALLAGAIEIAPSYAPAIRQQAIAAEMRGENDRAAEYYRQALRLDADDVVSAGRLAGLTRHAPEVRERMANARRRVEQQTDDARARLELADVLISQGETSEALAHYQYVARLEPMNADAHAGAGAALLVLGRTAEAVEPLRAALRLREGDYRVHGNLAMALAESDSAASVGHARRAAELRPDDVDVQLNLAAALARSGRTDEAVGALRAFKEKMAAEDPRRAMIEAEVRRIERRHP